MPKLKNRDVQKVIRLFDNELILLQRLSKVDKMRLRRRIVNIVQPALRSPIATPQIFMGTVDDKLANVTRLFFDRHGFRIKLANQVAALFKKAGKSPIPAYYSDSAETEEIDT